MYATRAASSTAKPLRNIGGRTTSTTMTANAAIGYAAPSISPARMKRVMPSNVSSRPMPAGASDRGFGVVVLVLVAVVARIVVLVPREVDLVEHDGREAR